MVTKNIMGKQYHQGRFIQMGESKTETKTKVIYLELMKCGNEVRQFTLTVYNI